MNFFRIFLGYFFVVYLVYCSQVQSIFPKSEGGIYSGSRKRVRYCLNTFTQLPGSRQLCDDVLATPSHGSLLFLQVFLSCLFFFCFLFDFHATIWRPFQALISSNLIFPESSKCIVSIGSSLTQFEVTQDITSRREVMQCRNFFLKNSFLPFLNFYHYFGRLIGVRQDTVLTQINQLCLIIFLPKKKKF